MQIRVVSDLHFEHGDPQGTGERADMVLDTLDGYGDPDVLIVAGDLANAKVLDGALHRLCARFKDSDIVVINGNHEFYGSSREKVVYTMHEAVVCHPNLYWLDNDIFVRDGVRFLGTPLWFPPTRLAVEMERDFSDFICIKDYRDWVYAENAKAAAFLRRELRPGDFVITHHLPSPRCISKKFEYEASNCYFMCDVEDLILEHKPAVWQYGHTHIASDFTIGDTRMVCNPFGYRFEQGKNGFRPDKTIVLGDV